ncbi:MAG: DJ-1/PfpI family protein [Bacteroidota bacterium]
MKKKNVGILLFDDAEVLDFAGPFEVFSVASEVHNYSLFDVFTFAKTENPIIAVNGLSVNPKYSFESVPKIDILIIPGGNGSRELIKDQAVLDKIAAIHEQNELTMTVCSGSRVPAVLGWLPEKPYCTHHQVYEHMQELVPTAIPKKELRYVQSDQHLYTSGGISAGIDLSFFLLQKLFGKSVVLNTAEYMEYRLENIY